MTFELLPLVVVYIIVGVAVAKLARQSASWKALTITYAWAADVVIIAAWPLILFASIMVMIVRALKT